MWLCLDICQDWVGGTFARMYIFVHFFYSHIDLSASLVWASVWWNFLCCDLICHSCYSNTKSSRWDLHVLHVQPSWSGPPAGIVKGLISNLEYSYQLQRHLSWRAASMKDRKRMSGMKTHIARFFNSQLWMTGAVINGGVRGAALVSSLVPVFSQVMRHPNKVGWLCAFSFVLVIASYKVVFLQQNQYCRCFINYCNS